jgi:predicted transcriptional regulator
MASRLLELAADIVASHASVSELSTQELIDELRTVYATLEKLDAGQTEVTAGTAAEGEQRKRRGRAPEEKAAPAEEPAPLGPALSLAEAFQADQVGCMICGKQGMKTLKRHLQIAHGLKPGQYRKQFNVPKETPLAASSYVEKRRQMAVERGLGENLAKARALRRQKVTV